MSAEPLEPRDPTPFVGHDLAGYVLVPAALVEHYEDLLDGAEIDRVKDDIRAGRDAMVRFRMEDYE
ncbi:hypothetical protein AB0I72_10020 [Nocardiopsis sp. NPDC049922]|uniref:hypothetical protein n=1 Tax=Nocardiopsis sp. NPDC049922 TaxID=3155157 RepID=UPI0034070F4C